MTIQRKRHIAVAIIVCLVISLFVNFLIAVIHVGCGSYVERLAADHLVSTRDQAAFRGMRCIAVDPVKFFSFEGAWFWASATTALPSVPIFISSISYGFLPGNKKSTTEKLPERLSTLTSAVATYRFLLPETSATDMLIKIYVTRKKQPMARDIDSEVVVQLSASPKLEKSSDEDIIFVSGHAFALKTSITDSTQIFTMRRLDSSTQGSLDILGVLRAVLKKNHSAGLYLSAVELGSNSSAAHGYAIVKDFDVRLLP